MDSETEALIMDGLERLGGQDHFHYRSTGCSTVRQAVSILVAQARLANYLRRPSDVGLYGFVCLRDDERKFRLVK